MERAFRYAQEADPTTLAFYNDYNVLFKNKQDKIVSMIQGIQSKGIKIDGMGIQAHVRTGQSNATRQDMAAAIKRFGDLGLQVHITELDVKASDDSQEEMQKQAQIYQDFLAACVFDNPGVCTAFLSWGFTDKYTWLGSNYYPLPFDQNYQKKLAYTAMLDLLNGKTDSQGDQTAFLQN